MRHSHRDLRRMAQRKLDALGARRQRLLNQRAAADRGLLENERMTRPVMDLLAAIDAQLGQEPLELVVEPKPAATPLLGQAPMRLLQPARKIPGLWK